MEATGNWGLDVAEALHGARMTVSIVGPSRIKAYGQRELARNKTGKLDAALIARFRRAHRPAAWNPPAAHPRESRELMRRRDGLKAMRMQEINRHIDETMTAVLRAVVAADPALEGNHALMLTISGIGPVTAATLLAAVPNITEFTPKALAASAGLSPQEHGSGSTIRRPGRISRMGSERLRRAL